MFNAYGETTGCWALKNGRLFNGDPNDGNGSMTARRGSISGEHSMQSASTGVGQYKTFNTRRGIGENRGEPNIIPRGHVH